MYLKEYLETKNFRIQSFLSRINYRLLLLYISKEKDMDSS